MKKLASSYNLSDDAQRALNEENIQTAVEQPNEAKALAATAPAPSTVNTVEDATRISQQLGRVNARLRAARK